MKKIENYNIIDEIDENFKECPIRLLLVDDQSFVRRFISKSVEAIDRLEIIGTAENGQEAIEKVATLQPDVVLIDLEMPQMDGVTATEIIAREHPNCKILILSSHEDSERLQNALRAGAKGYVVKGGSLQQLRDAIYSVHQGYTHLSPGLLEKVLTPEVEIVTEPEEPLSIETSEEQWADSTREAIETLPRVSLRALLYVLLGLILVAIPWTLFSRVDEIGSARGRLEPKGKAIAIDTPVSGKITAIEVREGERVTKGQSLIQIESTLVETELQQQRSKLLAQQSQLDRLKALKDQQLLAIRAQQQQATAQQFEKESLIDGAQQTLQGAKASYSSQIAEKAALVQQAKEAISVSESDYQMAQIRFRSATEKANRYEEAYAQGIISQDRLLEASQEAQEAQESLNRSAAEIAQAKSRYQEQQQGYSTLVSRTTAEIAQAESSYQEQQRGYSSLVKGNELNLLKAQEEFQNTEGEIAILQGEIAQTNSLVSGLNYQLQQRVLYAPASGVVFQLPYSKPGAVVQPGQNVAQIAPEDAPLILRARMNSRESGFLAVGLPVKVKFDAYPFQDYGIVAGTVSWVSPDSRASTASAADGNSGEFYELEIELERDFIQSGDRNIPLTPGQTATAEVVIRQRRLADIFIAPFKSLKEGGVQL